MRLARGRLAIQWVTLLVAIFGPSSQAAEPDTSSWIGRKVVTKYRAPLKVGHEVVAAGRVHRVYTVDKTQGSWLRLVSDHVDGWILASQVVPFDRAIEFYTGEIRNSRRPSRAYLERGLIFGDQGDQEQAIVDYTEAIRLNPSFAEAYGVRSSAWLARQEYDIALADLSEVIQLRPQDYKAYIDRGMIWARKGELDKAIVDFSESIRHEPNNAWAYNNRGSARRDKKEWDLAFADYADALRLDPKFVWAYINRGLTWGEKKEYDQAIADTSRAIALDPKNAYAYNNRAIFLQARGDYTQAEADFSEALRIDPKFQAARSGLALLLASCPDANLRDGKRAVELAREAFTASVPEVPVFCATLAAAYAETGDFGQAVSLQERAIGLSTRSEEKDDFRARLALYQSKKPFRQTLGRAHE
jgi:tetratricopeptide (TPR) repeat protein